MSLRLHLPTFGRHFVAALGLTAVVGGCSDGSSSNNKSNGTAGSGSSLAGSSSSNNGGANANGGTSIVGVGGSNSGGSSNNGGANGGGQAQAGSANGGGNGGDAPTGTPNGVMVATHDLAVNMGSVFNVADDYFNDGLIPPTPIANFGTQSQITTIANDDGSLDVAWLDYTTGKGKPWALNTPGPIYISHIDPMLGTATTAASGITSYKLLGFTKDAAGAFYLGYNKDHSFKTSTQGDANNINGNEMRVAKIVNGAPTWDTLLFGDEDQNVDATPGDPGGAGSGVLGYDAMNQKLVLYVAHSMLWTPTRHQAGYLRLLDPATGAVTPPHGDDILHFGAGWWYSHNFNQRLLIDGGNYYLLAHGDAYSRQLGFARWSVAGYTGKNDTDFNESYFKIAGNEGDNKTDTQTGQFIHLKDGRFLMVHTTSQGGRMARDVRLIFADGTTGKSDATAAVWLTQNTGTTQATMPKVEMLGDYVLVTYALWDSTKAHGLTWYAALLDSTLKTVAAPKVVPMIEFVDSAPLFQFKGGPNANAVGWVSGNATHSLSVHVATASF